MRKWEIGLYTITQLANALDQSDTSDPHSHGIPIPSLDFLDQFLD